MHVPLSKGEGLCHCKKVRAFNNKNPQKVVNVRTAHNFTATYNQFYSRPPRRPDHKNFRPLFYFPHKSTLCCQHV